MLWSHKYTCTHMHRQTYWLTIFKTSTRMQQLWKSASFCFFFGPTSAHLPLSLSLTFSLTHTHTRTQAHTHAHVYVHRTNRYRNAAVIDSLVANSCTHTHTHTHTHTTSAHLLLSFFLTFSLSHTHPHTSAHTRTCICTPH